MGLLVQLEEKKIAKKFEGVVWYGKEMKVCRWECKNKKDNIIFGVVIEIGLDRRVQ